MKTNFPKVIMITGVDGSGKSTLSEWLFRKLSEKGFKTRLVWSRFNNYLSKPLLALTRLSGHNYYRTYNGIRFGFHDFERLGFLRWVFIIFQAIDVNISTYFKITRLKRKYDILLCERGPLDTLVDLVADTGIFIKAGGIIEKVVTLQVDRMASVFLIDRSIKNILSTRPELVHDHKMKARCAVYRKLAEHSNWTIIDNNRRLEETMSHIANIIGLDYLKK